MRAKLPALSMLRIALIAALSACGDSALKDATPSANAAEVASVTPVIQPNTGMGASAQANMLTAVVSNPTPITDLTPSPATSAIPSPTRRHERAHIARLGRLLGALRLRQHEVTIVMTPRHGLHTCFRR
jgi:hypothetical protein